MRQCGDCQLCCKLVPVTDLGKKANVRCEYQKFRKGCTLHGSSRKPFSCVVWTCGWLANDDAAQLPRPDHSHYVIDPMPDVIRIRDNRTGEIVKQVPVDQIWCDPAYRDAHRDPSLRERMQRRARQGIATVVRFSSDEALTIFPPPQTDDGQWIERADTNCDPLVEEQFRKRRQSNEH